MKITYAALKPLTVGDEVRQPGDLVPEACTWPYLSGYVQDGSLMAVLVATLPEETQVALMEWEEDVLGVTTEDIPVAEQVKDEAPAPSAKSTKTKQKTGA